MDPEKLRMIVEEAIKNADPFKWWLYVVVILIAGLTSFLGSYLRRKAENLATKEDTAVITREVERIRVEYAERLENLSHQNRLLLEQANRRHQLRMAALDRRLEVHQQAYMLWQKLITTIHDDQQVHDGQQIATVVTECHNWWQRNCLYLEAEAREAFRIAYMAASQHHQITRGGPEYVERNLNKIMRPGQLLVEGVELPSISADVELPVATQKHERDEA
jgi:hypothetical protein